MLKTILEHSQIESIHLSIFGNDNMPESLLEMSHAVPLYFV